MISPMEFWILVFRWLKNLFPKQKAKMNKNDQQASTAHKIKPKLKTPISYY